MAKKKSRKSGGRRKGRSAAQKAATKRMLAANKRSKGGSKRKKGRAKSRSKHIPLPILKRRLLRLSSVIRSRTS